MVWCELGFQKWNARLMFYRLMGVFVVFSCSSCCSSPSPHSHTLAHTLISNQLTSIQQIYPLLKHHCQGQFHLILPSPFQQPPPQSSFPKAFTTTNFIFISPTTPPAPCELCSIESSLSHVSRNTKRVRGSVEVFDVVLFVQCDSERNSQLIPDEVCLPENCRLHILAFSAHQCEVKYAHVCCC